MNNRRWRPRVLAGWTITIVLLVLAGWAIWPVDDRDPATTKQAQQPTAGDSVETGAADSDGVIETDRKSTAEYVGRAACGECHPVQSERWSGSHHDLAMQEATEQTVLGDFDGASFTHFGVTSTFTKRDGKFFVHTDGPDGKLTDYQVRYAFGVTPLQQYLIEFPGGRLQALSVSWDARSAEEGGQRWFHLYPNEPIPHDDPLHWTGPNQNWNFACAECHSTNLQKNYDLHTNSYDTTFSEIDVSCEACHGPGSEHVAWAGANREGDAPYDGPMGLTVQLDDPGSLTWAIDMETGTAKRAEPFRTGPQIETCARCHSRRSRISDTYVHGRPLLDSHLPAFLDETLYYPDGQIRDEVYVYGSFLQSKMYQAGVTCSDCHDAHSLRLRGEGNALCYPCHRALEFDTPEHHHHESESPGALCVKCHMPETTYMVVDPRHDHSIRIPRADLSLRLGTPNACNRCHTSETAEWAASAAKRWYGSERTSKPHYGQILAAGRAGAPGAENGLAALIRDRSQPAIVRATALTVLNRFGGAASLSVLPGALADDDPLVRHAGLTALEMLRPDQRLNPGMPLLTDSVRGVRVEAARVLAAALTDRLTPAQQETMRAAMDEFVAATLIDAERPSAHLNLGVFLGDLGRFSEAEAEYRTALRLDPGDPRALINLSDLYRTQGRDDLCGRALRDALKIAPNSGVVHHSIGLLLARQRDVSGSVEELRAAVRLEPDSARFRYVYAVALNSGGRTAEALGELAIAHERHPYDRDVLIALTTIHRDSGSIDLAVEFARKLVDLAPEQAGFRELWVHLESLKDR